jgi:hypothetical protein
MPPTEKGHHSHSRRRQGEIHTGSGTYPSLLIIHTASPKYDATGNKKYILSKTNLVETPIVVLAKPPSSAPVTNFVEPGTQQITQCCCIPRGNITFAASISDTRVGRGEVVNVEFGCKTEAWTAILDVDAYFSDKIQ